MVRDTILIDLAGLCFLAIGVLLFVQVLSGCGADRPAVNVAGAHGSGGIELDVVISGVEFDVKAEFREVLATTDGETVRCTVVDELSLNGVILGSGYLPPPLSDSGCVAIYRPFRYGPLEPEPESVDRDRPGSTPDPGSDPDLDSVADD